MKKYLFILALILVTPIFAELMIPTPKDEMQDRTPISHRIYENNPRITWNFVVNPTSVLSNFYDYMPGSYNSIPVRIQPDAVGGGVYVTYHARETAAATRRVYYAYIDAVGTITNTSTISYDDIHEGYCGIDVDPVTGDPVVAWHANVDTGSADLEVVCTYDLFHLGSPGLWRSPFTIIDDNTPSPMQPADEFIWPYVYIGPSPITGKRRVYVVAYNSADSAGGDPSENPMIAHADFDVNDFNIQSELNWTYNTIQIMDHWHQCDPEWKRPNYGVAVSDDGKIALFGYYLTDSSSPNPDKMFCFVNDNYGVGDYILYEGEAEFDISNPQNQDGTYRFVDPGTGQPQQLYMAPHCSNHMNAIFTDGGTKIVFPGNMNMMMHPDSWYPDLSLNYPKIYSFDLVDQQFSFTDIHIPGANPDDNIPMIPWDLDEDGNVDQFDPNGYVTWVDGWSIYHDDESIGFHENNYKITKNDDNDWLCAVWSDGLKSRLGAQGEPGYLDWEGYPEIAVAISADNGETWSETLLMNAKVGDTNYVAELDGMIPEYVYPGDKIEDLGNDHGLLHLFFLDDNSFGSTIQGHGENLGGTMTYMSIDLDFSDYQSDLNADFSANPISGNAPLSVQFNDMSTSTTQPITSWEWDFNNDGVIDSYLENPSHIYQNTGNYTVKLIISNGTSSDTEVKQNYISVNNPVSADFYANPFSGYAPLEVQFTDSSMGNIISWEWDFDNDGTIDSYDQYPIHEYSEIGIYDVSLTVSDGTYYATELKNDYIEVNGPIADFEADITSGYAPLTVQFNDLSLGTVESWEWDFNNDGIIDSYEQNPLHTYTEIDSFSVVLTIHYGDYSNQLLVPNYITTHDHVVCDFTGTPTSGLIPLTVQFSDLSAGTISQRLWDFNNDGIVDSNEPNPTCTYTTQGVYSVNLWVSDGIENDFELKENYINVTLTGAEDLPLPVETKLHSNFPNPFNPITYISFEVMNNETAQLLIYNLKGQILLSNTYSSGRYHIPWNASKYSSGVYFYKLKSASYEASRKMILMK